MTHPYGPPGYLAPVAHPHPVPLPAGAGALVVTVSRGPYVVPVPATCKLKIDGREVPIPGAGTWHIPVPAGPHEVKYTDFLGVPMVRTDVVVQPGTPSYLDFRFGVWRNRVYDGQGADVTRFGMWSNYLIALIGLISTLVICCGGGALLAALD
ncbi:hypothetical protein [Micromonospora sp. HM5-17]|jgi:hypothetical protein|uniref:hypothetical protein n=1 Tax=Micromonospora sp. HM5-17 TaxID=2487710 RepID=UPI000F47EA42|nr:hypothetical protein [Micromonospora sp. HM5-17]ROT31118.1 hypothetical protein EF879_15905 [Micromonospora sp. HM5-17]